MYISTGLSLSPTKLLKIRWALLEYRPDSSTVKATDRARGESEAIPLQEAGDTIFSEGGGGGGLPKKFLRPLYTVGSEQVWDGSLIIWVCQLQSKL